MRKKFFKETLFSIADDLRWGVDAWVVLENHYHVILRTDHDTWEVTRLIRPLHSLTAKYVNRLDGTSGRRVWQNYWDTLFTSERAYFVRMRYIHLNPVKHGEVENPEEYEFSSYVSFLKNADARLVQSGSNGPVDRVQVQDDF